MTFTLGVRRSVRGFLITTFICWLGPWIVACRDAVAPKVSATPARPADPVVTLTALSSPEQTGTVGEPVASRPTVVARDAARNPLGGVAVAFTGEMDTTVSTGLDGVASIPWILPTGPGSYSIVATTRGAQPVSFLAVARSGPPASINALTPVDQVFGTGATIVDQPTFLVVDRFGNPLSGIDVSFETGASGGTVASSFGVTNLAGIGTPGEWAIGPAPAVYTLIARVAGVQSMATLKARVTGPFVASSIAAGSYATCANSSSGTTYCWGNGATTPMVMQGSARFVSITVGTGFGCGLTSSGAVYCWGRDITSLTSAGTLPSPASFVVPRNVGAGISFSHISAGDTFACALDLSGRAYCWGDNTFGQLGDGTTTARATPTPIAGGYSFTSISAGLAHACGLSTSGEAYCWGMNNARQLGDPSSMICSTMPFDEYFNEYYVINTSCSTIAQRVTGAPSFASISAGEGTCGLANDASAYCWGFGTGVEPIAPSIQFANVMAMGFYDRERPSVITMMCGTSLVGAMYCRRSDQLDPVLVSPGLVFSTIASGAEHECGLVRATHEVYCWGQNRDGQLGNGSRTQAITPQPVASPEQPFTDHKKE